MLAASMAVVYSSRIPAQRPGWRTAGLPFGGGAARGPSQLGRPTQPQHRFLVFFSGHQGSSALADMLASDPSVFVPGFEPLDFPGLSPAEKTAFMEAVFTFPPNEARHGAWRREILRGKRINRSQLASYAQLAGKTVAGFKMRPYTLDGDRGSQGNDAGRGSRTLGSRLHTAATGLSPAALKAVLDRYNVSVVLTLRRNRLKEALSWYKARVLGIHQFQGSAKAAKASANFAAAAAGGELGWPGQEQQLIPQADGRAGIAGADGLASGGKVRVNITAVRGWLAYTEAVNVALRRAVVAARRPTLTVWYEDFLVDPAGEAQRAAEFVGVPHGGSGSPLASKFSKAGPDAIQDWVENIQVHGTGGRYRGSLGTMWSSLGCCSN